MSESIHAKQEGWLLKQGEYRVKRNIYLSLSIGLTSAVIAGFSSQSLAVERIQEVASLKPQNLKLDVSEDQMLTGAQNFVISTTERALNFLADPSISEKERAEEFRKLLETSFDMKTIGRFSLGRYWRTSTQDQRSEYLHLFEEMVINVYSRRFGEYQGEKIEVRDVRHEGKSDAIVSSYIIQDHGPEIRLDWRVRYKNGQYKVIDIIVEGVSMALTQRSDFASVIQRGGGNVESLLAHLRQ